MEGPGRGLGEESGEELPITLVRTGRTVTSESLQSNRRGVRLSFDVRRRRVPR